MPLPVIADTWRCAINWSNVGASLTAENVIHVQGTGLDPAAIAAALDASVNLSSTFCFDAVSTQMIADSVDITPLDGTGSSFAEPLTEWAGQNASDPIPAVACTVSERTANRGRSFRGRMFLPGVAEAQVSKGIIDPTVIATMQDGWTRFITAMAGHGVNWVVASYKLASQHPVTQVIVRSKASTQRRRQSRI